jgi:hypothetical protein
MPWRVYRRSVEPETLTVTFQFQLGQAVLWANRPGYFVTVWRRYHEGDLGAYLLYGLTRAEERAQPAAQVWTALEADLRAAE